MTLDPTRVRVKAGWPDVGGYELDATIADALAAMEGEIGPLPADPPAALVLAGVEIAAGELAALRLREPGALDSVTVGGVRVDPPDLDPLDPTGLVARGLARLRSLRREGVRA